MAGHTPGPWALDLPRSAQSRRITIAGARVGVRIDLAETTNVLPRDVAEANARLMAAAPDLLAAAKDAYVALPRTKHNEPINAALEAAIAKAEGR